MTLWVSFMSMLNAGSLMSVPPYTPRPAQLVLEPTPQAGPTAEELWEWQIEPKSGYYFITNLYNKLTVGVGGVRPIPIVAQPPIETATQKVTDSQLWQFVLDPGGSGYYFIQSKLSTSGNLFAISVAGASAAIGASLNLSPVPPVGPTPSQLWIPIVTLPPTLSASMACNMWIPELMRYLTTGGYITVTEQQLYTQAIKQCDLTTAQMNEALNLLSQIPIISNEPSGPTQPL